ncbi:hypothetical protein CsSME_00000704 [Camellia sinensis var. sinensis]
MFNLSCWSSVLRLGFHHFEVVLAKEKLKLEKSPEFQIFAWSARAEGFPLERENRPPSSFGFVQSARADKVALERGTYFRKV